MRVMALFSTSVFAKYLRVGEDGPGRGQLCHTDTFLVCFFFFYGVCVCVWGARGGGLKLHHGKR